MEEYSKKDLQAARTILNVNADEIQVAVFIRQLKEKAACEAYKKCVQEQVKFRSVRNKRRNIDFSTWLQYKSDKLHILNNTK